MKIREGIVIFYIIKFYKQNFYLEFYWVYIANIDLIVYLGHGWWGNISNLDSLCVYINVEMSTKYQKLVGIRNILLSTTVLHIPYNK